ncbi:hypothetical protein [Metaplanococcus flavidus]|uniref:Uncharacterized protein n=1 Tax=Metaplanococcus flavidus TaxID=569883 RepID=A0ABW3LCL8_9BACL
MPQYYPEAVEKFPGTLNKFRLLINRSFTFKKQTGVAAKSDAAMKRV